jgi:type I restriction enzyme, S subunit
MIQQSKQQNWREIPLEEALDYEQPVNYIINTKILDEGKIPVLTPGKSFIKGYVNETQGIYKNTPIILFDDFTTSTKIVNFPFKVKSSALKILKTKTDSANLKFIYYQMQTKEINFTTHKRYYLSIYSKMPFVFPVKDGELDSGTQSAIVSAIETQFTRLDAAVKSLKNLKQKIELYRKAVLKKAFELDEYKTFPEIISKEKHSMKRGPFGGSLKKEIFVPKGYLVYEQNHAINNNFDFGRYFITMEKFEEMKGFSVKPGDLLISCSGTIGKIAEIPKDNFREGIINQALLKITLDNSKVFNKYFIYLFESEIIQKYLTKVSRGVAIKNVPSVKELKEIKFPIPDSLDKQSAIVSSIESKFSIIDKVEQAVDNSLKKAEMLRKSILKSAFEGKLVK